MKTYKHSCPHQTEFYSEYAEYRCWLCEQAAKKTRNTQDSNVNVLAPADGWIPFDLEVARREPERVRHTLRLDLRLESITDSEAGRFNLNWTGGERGGANLVSLEKYLRLAQPAAQSASGPCACHDGGRCQYVNGAPHCGMSADGWHPTSIPPEEGRVVDARSLDSANSAIKLGKVLRGQWLVSTLNGAFVHATANYEWRYPAADPSDAATINAGTEHGGQRTKMTASQEAPAGEHAPAPAPYRSRNGYGLRIREADVRHREPLLISYDVFRRMK